MVTVDKAIEKRYVKRMYAYALYMYISAIILSTIILGGRILNLNKTNIKLSSIIAEKNTEILNLSKKIEQEAINNNLLIQAIESSNDEIEMYKERRAEQELERVNVEIKISNDIICYYDSNTGELFGVEPKLLEEGSDGKVTSYTDLKLRRYISKKDMQDLINYFAKQYPNSKFHGTAEAFIAASAETGYDPVFLLALAGLESGWNVSTLHAKKNNPYSIAMVDSNPSSGYTLGTDFSEGVYNGAVWIYDKYYSSGRTTLYSMIYGGRRYASAGDHWIDGISNIMNVAYNYLDH